MSARRGLAGSSVTMFTGTLVSRVLGLVKGPVLLVAVLGANTGASNAFDVANRLPNIIYLLVAGGVLNAVLVPQIVRAMTKDEDGGDDYVSRLLTAITLGLAGLTVVLTLASPLLVRFFAFGMEDPWYSMSVAFAYWCIPQLFFYGMYTLLGQVLNARGIFGPYTWAPVVNNVVAIAGLLVFMSLHGSAADMTAAGAADWGPDRTLLLAGTATAGVAAQALVLLWPLRSAGIRLRPRFGFRGRGLGSATSTAMWVFAALIVGQLATLAISNVAAAASASGNYALDVPGNAAYTNAYFLYSLPTSLIVVSLITALFTRMATSAATNDLDAVRADLSLGLRVVGMFTVFCAAGLTVLALPLVRVITPAASFPEVRSIAMVLVAMLVGLVGVGAFTVIQRVYYAFEDARRLFFLQLPLTGIVVGGALLSLLLGPRWVLVGACVAMGLSNVVGAALSFLGLRPRLGHTDGGRVVRAHVRITIAAAVPVLAGWGLLTLLGTEESDLSVTGALARLLGVGIFMVLGYFVTLRALHVEELEVVARPLGTMVAGLSRRLTGPLRAVGMAAARVLDPRLRRAGGPPPAGPGDGPGDGPAASGGVGAPVGPAPGPGAGRHGTGGTSEGWSDSSSGGSSDGGPTGEDAPTWAGHLPADDAAVDPSRDLPWAPHVEGAWEPVWQPGRRNRPRAGDDGATGAAGAAGVSPPPSPTQTPAPSPRHSTRPSPPPPTDADARPLRSLADAEGWADVGPEDTVVRPVTPRRTDTAERPQGHTPRRARRRRDDEPRGTGHDDRSGRDDGPGGSGRDDGPDESGTPSGGDPAPPPPPPPPDGSGPAQSAVDLTEPPRR